MGSDPVIEFLQKQAKSQSSILKIILFGSRARESAHARSDYDIAVDASTLSEEQWAEWALFVREKIPTLCGVDLIRIRPEMSIELRDKILSEGKVIYERTYKAK